MLIQVDLIRGRTLRLLQQLSIYISCLPKREQEALERLSGPEGQRTFARITDFVLSELGHQVEEQEREEFRRSYRKAQNYAPDLEPKRKQK